ncbi:MAG: hypothetical protein ACJAS1_002477 [Oleiphilaceae bacterium]|jgi:hypothetical protein
MVTYKKHLIAFLAMFFLAIGINASELDRQVYKAECEYRKALSSLSNVDPNCRSRTTLPGLAFAAAAGRKQIPIHKLYAEQEAISFGLPPLILQSIIKHESGETCMVKRNNDGSFDLGRAQINTIHADQLYKLAKVDVKSVACDDRINALIAAWHLKRKQKELQKRGNNDIWAAVGRYHDKRQRYAAPYIQKVKKAYVVLLKQGKNQLL